MTHTIHNFATQYNAYKQAIDDDIAAYADSVRKSTKAQFGAAAALEADAFLQTLAGGKRLRGVLTLIGYEMCGGQNRAMVLQAARAMEMLHAYVLIIDDMQDRSPTRRGQPSAHAALAAYHRTHNLRGDAEHFGLSVALNAAIAGAHAAQATLANLDAEPQLRLNVLSITNRTLGITAHGQTDEFFVAAHATPPSTAELERILEWKTALYSVINPLHVGMVLAGANCHATDAITPYATHVGKAYQLANDLEGAFGDATSQRAGEDILDGKLTSVITYALRHAIATNRQFLQRCLGKGRELPLADLTRCQEIIEQSGATAYVQRQIQQYVQLALRSLDAEKHRWSTQGVHDLQVIAQALADER
ncbi:MAG TPA: polyprenyl synthetase family protein [Candidatus Saccharimonadales bacterium]|nr:polyprenyl synthetase family protein [Candidatus Saccharimonadales bacterium]